jgi:hypothetical protein
VLVVHETTSELEHTIMTILLFAGVENTNKTRSSKLCHAIVSPLMVRGQLSEGMWIVVIRHTKMAEQFTVLQALTH